MTSTHRNWGFGLCFLYLRNVKRFSWNHKRVYRLYRDLELNLRIKTKKRLKREKPEPLKGLGIEIDFSLPAERVIRSLEQIFEWRGKPKLLRCDNGPECISAQLIAWAERQGIGIIYIQPGKP